MRLLALLLALLALAGCGTGSGDDVAAPPPAPPTNTEPPPTFPEVEVSCSTAPLRIVYQEQPGLPAPVAAKRKAIFQAALACDYDTLGSLASQDGFNYTFGETGDPAAYWRRVEQEKQQDMPMATLVRILSLPYARNELKWYAWPSAYQEHPSAADWQALVDAHLYPADEVAQMRAAGSYLGWRTAIRPDGAWMFFVAGD